ncbi:hypothetical protein [Dyadobacter psychrotolerans]|uniref:hypothetical protein n=1 Tax=Dyadobacter psychrotolerans TaxID=2541721 RepID=UPI001C70FE25|nr:hypothetical protein [Dyadobacter psychrotolerans]
MKRTDLKKISKGIRLNWTPIKEVSSVDISTWNLKGIVVSDAVIKSKKTNPSKTIIP